MESYRIILQNEVFQVVFTSVVPRTLAIKLRRSGVLGRDAGSREEENILCGFWVCLLQVLGDRPWLIINQSTSPPKWQSGSKVGGRFGQSGFLAWAQLRTRLRGNVNVRNRGKMISVMHTGPFGPWIALVQLETAPRHCYPVRIQSSDEPHSFC